MQPLPQWPTFDVAHPHPFFVRLAHLNNCLLALDYHTPERVGILVNGDMESALTASAVGDHDQSFNVWQWKWDPRGKAIAQALSIDVRTERDPMKICMALNWELTHKFPALVMNLVRASTGAEAAGMFCQQFEMAGAADAMQRRQLDAPRVEVFLADNAAWVAAQGTGS